MYESPRRAKRLVMLLKDVEFEKGRLAHRVSEGKRATVVVAQAVSRKGG